MNNWEPYLACAMATGIPVPWCHGRSMPSPSSLPKPHHQGCTPTSLRYANCSPQGNTSHAQLHPSVSTAAKCMSKSAMRRLWLRPFALLQIFQIYLGLLHRSLAPSISCSINSFHSCRLDLWHYDSSILNSSTPVPLLPLQCLLKYLCQVGEDSLSAAMRRRQIRPVSSSSAYEEVLGAY